MEYLKTEKNDKKPDIIPETKIGTLLEFYPELEEELLQMAPAFKKLRNPVLRKTVAKVANLRQVAETGKIPLRDLINRLREKSGLNKLDVPDGENADTGETPVWVARGEVIETFDARPLLAGGGHPVQQAMEAIGKLRPGELYLLKTPFLPAPLIDMAEKKGFRVWTEEASPDLFLNYFGRKSGGQEEAE